MKKIKLTQGKFALIDDEDYGMVSLFKWFACKAKKTFYAATNIRLNDKRMQFRMHRLIANVSLGKYTDHKDHDGLNNQKSNLRECTNSENHMNRKSQKGSSSKYKGVSWDKRLKKWRATISFNGKWIYLGLFENEINAAKQYDEFANKYFGEFARLNYA